METEMLNYYLPPELIAQRPLSVRSDSRLLVFNRSPIRDTAYNGGIIDSRFSRLGDFLFPGDCLVLNDAKVLPARFFARRCTRLGEGDTEVKKGIETPSRSWSGGKLEGLFLAESADGVWEVILKGARKVKAGEKLYLTDRSTPAIAGSATAGKQKQTRLPKVYGGQDFCTVEVLERVNGGKCRLKVNADGDAETILDRIGFPPLPPYIKRNDDPRVAAVDKLRYQTVYARVAGAVAAPTAGLHFTNQLIQQLKQAGICFAYLTLHVGEGTFKPIRTENLEGHQMHQERFSIDEENTRIINAAKDRGSRIIAVGTTSARTLETITTGSRVKTAAGATSLFIKPGYKFKIVDAMITNFHLPKSTLLALVAAFAGLENILVAYRHAIEQRYRFYSYGDAMLII